MSNYIKKILLLKGEGELNGDQAILQGESSAQGVSLKLKLPQSMSKLSDTCLVIGTGDDIIILDCQDEQYCALKLTAFCAGIFQGEKLICFGSASNEFQKQKFVKDFRAKSALLSPNAIAEIQNSYDDECIAQANYYDNQPISEDLYVSAKQNNWNVEAEKCNQEKENPSNEREETNSYETNAYSFQSEISTAYYRSIESKLSELFSNHEKFTRLEEVIPQSKWVKIQYTIDKYYIVGIIKKSGEPQYICYGVPGKYSNPPEKLKDLASFIPLSLFNLAEDGFFVMFQSAKSGKRLVPNIDIFGL